MSRIVAIGEEAELLGYALAGVEIAVAADPDSVRRAWAELGVDVGLVLLTPTARVALPDRIDHAGPLSVVLPP